MTLRTVGDNNTKGKVLSTNSEIGAFTAFFGPIIQEQELSSKAYQ